MTDDNRKFLMSVAVGLIIGMMLKAILSFGL
jgi:hypothetical protein